MPTRMKQLFTLLFWGAASLASAETFIVENGQPRAEIVIAKKPMRSVRIAADDLQTFVQKMSRAWLPIVTEPSGKAMKLFVGCSERTDRLGVTAEGLKFGAYRLVRGSLNAVCGFLMKLGVRWYLPGELGDGAADEIHRTAEARRDGEAGL